MVYLQQDAFDEVDAAMSREKQQESFALLKRIVQKEYNFKDKEEARTYFISLTGYYKNLNYTQESSPEYKELKRKISLMIEE